ncbi:hypothetical protein CTAYLR_001246 [Chrysophaeum taylorii]|uniref:OTU domain-containing protein n=1 Tax=Chrysophaeum taylorii TaxID=2483200 RepID=A0AAD7UCP6_9STRA|nr:hypothetical protein CTAYLR_001246 [Chrysophaeum taylorii]
MGKQKASRRHEKRVRKEEEGNRDREAREVREQRLARREAKKEAKKKRGKRHSSDEDKLFRSQLSELGLGIAVMDGDGNCLFRSLEDQLYGNEGKGHFELRSKIARFEEEEREHFEHFVEDDEPFDDYVARMRTDGEWGGNLEMVAASMLFKSHVVVHQLSSPRYEIRCRGATRTLHLSFHGESHYNSVRLLDDPGLGRPPKGLPHLETDDDGPTPEETLSRAAPWAPVAAVRAALAATDASIDDSVELLVEHRTNGTLDRLGVSSDSDEDPSTRRRIGNDEPRRQPQHPRASVQTRGGPCKCGSGRPYKKCCRPADLKKVRQEHQQQRRRDEQQQQGQVAAPTTLPVTAAALGALRI